MSKQSDHSRKAPLPKPAHPKAPPVQQHTSPHQTLLQLAREDPSQLSPSQIVQLQQTVGSRAVFRLLSDQPPTVSPAPLPPRSPAPLLPPIQAKLTVNAVGDKYEQEADVVAKEVVQKLNAPQTKAASPNPQRQTDEEELSAQRIQRQEMNEEEMMSQRVQRQEIPEEEEMQLQRQETEDDDLQLQRQELEEEELPEMAMAQRQATPEEEEMQLQRQELPEEEEMQLQRQEAEEDDLQLQRQELEEQEEMENFSLSEPQLGFGDDGFYNIDLLDGNRLKTDPELSLAQDMFEHAYYSIDAETLSLQVRQAMSQYLPSEALDEILQQDTIPTFTSDLKEKLGNLVNSKGDDGKGVEDYLSSFAKLNAKSLLKLPSIDLLIPIPVPKIGLFHLELNTENGNQFIGLHLDMGKLLSGSFPFKESEPKRISEGLENPSIQRQEMPEEEEMQLQRQELEEEDPENMAMAQRQPHDFTQGGAVDGSIEAQINQSRGGGRPMEDSVRQPMEQAFGADFSDVRIHTDSQAHNLNGSIQARAFTTGGDIYFKEGEYSPGSSSAQELLAHELTHVIQQEASAPLARKVQRRQNDEKETETATTVAAPVPDANGNQATEAFSETVPPTVTVGENGEDAASTTEMPTAESGSPAKIAETNGQTAEPITAPTPTHLAQPEAVPAGPTTGSPIEVPQPNGEAQVSEGERAPASAAEDLQFQAAVQDVVGAAAEQKVHDPATAKSAEAQAAATMPASEKRGAAQNVQAGMIGSAAVAQEAAAQGDSAPGFDKAAFKNAIKAKVQGLKPEDPKEMEDFENSEAIRGAETVVTEQVTAGKTTAKGEIDDRAEESPDETAVPDKPTTPLQPNNPGPPPPAIDAARAAPKNKTAAEVEKPLADDSRSLDQKMAEADITEAQLENSNEPEFTEALSAKRESQEHAQTAPASYREGEKATVGQAKEQAEAIKESGLEGMVGQRGESFGLLDTLQEGAKGHDEARRQEIGEQINGIYEATRTDVEKILDELDTAVDSQFQSGAASAKETAVDYIKRETSAYKKERYVGDGDLGDLLEGGVNFVGDALDDMPPEYYEYYNQGFNLYVAEIDKVLDRVADIVGDKITQAKNRVEQGRQQIADFVAQQPQDLQQIAQEAAADIQAQFDALEQNIDERQDQIIDRLAQQYSDNLQSLNAELEAMKEADKGLWGKASDLLDGVIGKILELKNQLLDIFAGASDAVTLLLADPIGFLDNLIAGIGQGLEGFVANIGDYLQEGLVEWLVGSLTGAGIQLPENWDLPGIFQLVLQILEVSFEQIMGKVSDVLGVDVLVAWEPLQQVMGIYQESGWGGLLEYGLERIIGEENMAQLMETFEIVQVMMAGDFGRLWEIIKEYLGDLKEMIFGQIQEYLTESVIKQGITWIMSMLNPASAFVRACMMIVDVVKFFIERAEQVKSLIEAIVNAVRAIANGDVSALAQGVEQALARFIPTAIGFMASLLNLGDISQKVQDIIKDVRQFVDKAIDSVFNSGPIQAVTGFIKKIIAKITALAQAGWQKAKNALGFGDEENGEIDAGEKREATQKAVSMVDALQFEQASVDEVISELNSLKLEYNWIKRFEARENPKSKQQFTILMIASETKIGYFTEPSGKADPNAKPFGKRTNIGENEDEEVKRSLQRENDSADLLAKSGYAVEQNPKSETNKNPDYKIEGNIFDNYAPRSSKPLNIWSNIATKVNSGQADRIVLNLSDSNLDTQQLQALSRTQPIHGLKEILIIKDDSISRFPLG